MAREGDLREENNIKYVLDDEMEENYKIVLCTHITCRSRHVLMQIYKNKFYSFFEILLFAVLILSSSVPVLFFFFSDVFFTLFLVAAPSMPASISHHDIH